MKPKWVEQDPALINGDICIRCGHCCKATLQVHQPFKKDDGHKRQKTEYIATVFADTPGIKILDVTNSLTGKTRVSIQKTCAKLTTNDQGHKLCSIYKNRPAVCSAFNCIQTANHSKTAPQNWERIKELIDQYPTEGVELLI